MSRIRLPSFMCATYATLSSSGAGFAIRRRRLLLRAATCPERCPELSNLTRTHHTQTASTTVASLPAAGASIATTVTASQTMPSIECRRAHSS